MKNYTLNPAQIVELFDNTSFDTNMVVSELENDVTLILPDMKMEDEFGNEYRIEGNAEEIEEYMEKEFFFDVVALIEEKRTDLAEALCEAYQTDSSYNTDVILEKDGTIRSHNYFGSVVYGDDDIAYIFPVTNSFKADNATGLQEGLTQEQLDFVLERGWVTIWETNSDDPADWIEYWPTWDDYVEIVDKKIEELKSDTV